MNTSDHCNRAKYIEPRLNRVFGVLLGKQEGKTLELINTVEIAYKVTEGKIEMDVEFIKRRLTSYKKMFPNLDCVGWYSTGSDQKTDYPLEDDNRLQ
jgi:COP9 signalosome complex subunit 6